MHKQYLRNQVAFYSQIGVSGVTFFFFFLTSISLLPWPQVLCELFDTWGGICTLPGGWAWTPGGGANPPELTCQHRPDDKWWILSVICRYKTGAKELSAKVYTLLNLSPITSRLNYFLLSPFSNSCTSWTRGGCRAAYQRGCRGKQDAHCFLLDLSSRSCSWGQNKAHKYTQKSASWHNMRYIFFFLIPEGSHWNCAHIGQCVQPGGRRWHE